MFDQLFERPSTLKRHLNGPMLESRLHYLNYCAEQGASKATLRVLAREMLIIIDYMDLERTEGEVDIAEIENSANRWSNRQTQHLKMQHPKTAKERFISVATSWLRFIGRLSPNKKPLSPYSHMIDDFADYMKKERGLTEATIHTYCRRAKDFLDRIYHQNLSLNELSITEIQEAIASKGSQEGYARYTIRGYALSVRAFLGYAEMKGWCKAGLSKSVMTPRIYKENGLPTGPSRETVQRMIACIADDPMGKRDKAIIMLIAVYGLRSGEVRKLRIEDIDWEQEQFTIYRSKQGKTQTYPLSYTVGETILRYLKEVRPRCQYREIFLTVKAPIQPLDSATIYGIVRRYFRKLQIQSNHYGPHSLRHACASHLLAEGFSLKEIGDYLGHRDPDTTRVYAKVDLKGLREVADFHLGGLL